MTNPASLGVNIKSVRAHEKISGVKCPSGWVPYHSGCYKLYLQKKKFSDARKFCKSEGGEIQGSLNSDLFTVWDDYELALGQTFFRDDQVSMFLMNEES